MAAHEAAIKDIRAMLDGEGYTITESPDVSTQGQNPTASVYRSGTSVNIHREFAYTIMVAFHVPTALTFVSGESIERVNASAEALLDWLADVDNSREWLVYWPEPPTASLDIGEGATATVSVVVCDEYPR